MAIAVQTTKITASGQATIPKVVRAAMGVGVNDNVYWLDNGDGTVTVSKFPAPPNLYATPDEAAESIQRAREDIANGKVADAAESLCELRKRYGL